MQDEGEVTAREEARFFDVLAKLRAGDAKGLAQHKVPGTDDEEEEDDSEADSEAAERGSRPAKRAKLLKDVLAEQVCTLALLTRVYLHAHNWNPFFAHFPCSHGSPKAISTHWSGAEPFFLAILQPQTAQLYILLLCMAGSAAWAKSSAVIVVHLENPPCTAPTAGLTLGALSSWCRPVVWLILPLKTLCLMQDPSTARVVHVPGRLHIPVVTGRC